MSIEYQQMPVDNWSDQKSRKIELKENMLGKQNIDNKIILVSSFVLLSE